MKQISGQMDFEEYLKNRDIAPHALFDGLPFVFHKVLAIMR